MHRLTKIPESKNWRYTEKINKGWSYDTKYLVVTKDYQKLVLRVADISKLPVKEREFKMLQELHKVIPNMSKPISYGSFDHDQYSYILLSYIEGEQAEIVLPKLSKHLQYEFGFTAGKLLKTFHQTFPKITDIDWVTQYNKKIDQRIEMYQKCGMKSEIVEQIIRYVNQNRSLITNDRIIWQHGDFHVGNLIISDDMELFMIDFNRIKTGDAYYEFNRILISSLRSEAFAKGQIDGYFDARVPKDFFPMMKFYIATVLIGTLAWALQFGENDVKFALDSLNSFYDIYDGLRLDIPNWYHS
jgi:aminoglycoside phosphotransferase (APT) family kinase protein